MNDEIKEIIINNCGLQESSTIIEYITNLQEEINKLTAESTEWESKCYDLQEENKEYKRLMSNVDINSVDYIYDKDTKLYTFDRKNWYKINKKLDERFNYKQRIDKAIEYMKENMKDSQLVFGINDINKLYIKNMNDLLNILNGGDDNE